MDFGALGQYSYSTAVLVHIGTGTGTVVPRMLEKNKDTKPRITAAQIARLDAMDFTWSRCRGVWDTHFNELVAQVDSGSKFGSLPGSSHV
eukprot:SAG25_NODE_285_length_10382_cov_55.777108_11_plen_90_part_00